MPIWLQAQSYEIVYAPFNSAEADFGGTFYEEQFLFTSARQKTAITYNVDTLNQFFTDLYATQILVNGQWQNPAPLTGRVNTMMNEAQCTISSDGKQMYYTGNLKNALSKKKEKSEKYELGIFHASYLNKEWIADKEFEYNCSQSLYSCGHPCYAQNDSTLYFSSNQPGGFGGSDIYFCELINGAWSKPKNLGPIINTPGNEFFPFINDYGTLFFSSDSRTESEGIDIFSCQSIEDGFDDPIRLPEPINSQDDDFAYSEKKGSNKGCISSNRNDDNDNIYFFTKYEDNYNHCITNAAPIFCYSISDENYPSLDSLPYLYEWQISDGKHYSSSQFNHCFSDFGTYNIALNIRDTLTKNLVLVASTSELSIAQPTDPYIEGACTWIKNSPAKIHLVLPKESNIDTTQIEWFLNDAIIGRGQVLTYQAVNSGEYTLQARLKTKATKKISAKKICVEQIIQIEDIKSDQPVPYHKTLAIASPDQVSDANGTLLLPKYYLSLARNLNSIPPSDKRLSSSTLETLEMTNGIDFIYVVEEFSDIQSMLQAHHKYAAQGIQLEVIKSLTHESLYYPTAGTSGKIEPSNVSAISIPDASYLDLRSNYERSLRYTSAILKIESTMRLQIISYYDETITLEMAKHNSEEIKKQLEAYNVEPAQTTFFTEYRSKATDNHQIKLILQYPNAQ